MLIDINKIKVHEEHEKIYSATNIEDLKQSIQELGLLQPLIVNKRFVLISGFRRFTAVKQLNFSEVEVEIRDFSQEDEVLALISFNKQRVKTTRELLNEANALNEILSKKRGRKSKTDTTKDINITKPANTRNEIAAELNVKSTTLYKLQYIDKHIPEFIDKIDEGKLNTDQAYRAIKKSEEDKINRNITAILPTTITTDYYKIFNQSSDDLSELDDESVNCIMTSPPYWMKRTFSNISDELGAEKTSEEYVRNIVEHLNDSYRVLKKDGSFFLNIGDTFKDKCLQLIPYRVAIELQKKGWIIRNSIIWHRNSLPFTTKDNLTSSYEFIFHLVKSKNYFYNEVLLPLKNQSITVNTFARKSGRKCLSDNAKVIIGGLKEGKKLEDYWTCDVVKTAIANQSEVKKYGGTDHAAPFPKEVPILPILQTTRPGDVVLDLFSGSGTTSAVALLLGRKTIAYEVNTNYNQLQINRFDDAIRIYNDHDQAKLAA